MRVRSTATLLLLLAGTLPRFGHPWCSPADSGDCALNIRAGKRTTDENYRAVHFLNHAHTLAAEIRVQPATNRMEFALPSPRGSEKRAGAKTNPQLTVSGLGVEVDAGLSVRGTLAVADGVIEGPLANVTKMTARSISAGLVSVQNISVTGELRSKTFVAEESLQCVRNVLSSDTRERPGRGAYLDALGSVEIFSDASDAHVDLKSTPEEDFSVRALQATPNNGLLLHGQHVLITAAGKVGVGVDVPTHAMHINGRVRAASATITTGSDRRIKENVRDANASHAAERIRRLRVRQYDLIPAYAASQGIQVHRRVNRTGFVAQELREIFPEAVDEGNATETFKVGTDDGVNGAAPLQVDRLLTVDLEPVLFDLVQTVQRLQKELEEVKSQRCQCAD